MKYVLILLFLTGCLEDYRETCFKDAAITCLREMYVKNPDCVSVVDYVLPKAHASVTVTTTAVNNAARRRRERERKRQSCVERPTIPVCVEWKVIGEKL